MITKVNLDVVAETKEEKRNRTISKYVTSK